MRLNWFLDKPESDEQLELFVNNEPEIKGQLLAFTVLLGNLIGTLIENGCLTKEQARSVFHHSDLRTCFIILENLKDTMPADELERMETQARLLIAKLDDDLAP